MLLPRLLTSFTVFLWCATPSPAQLPKRSEQCHELKKEGPDVTADAGISAELGQQYRLGTIAVVPSDSDRSLSFNSRPLRKEFRLQPGQILNVGEIHDGLGRVTKIYREFGFIDMTAEPKLKIDDAKKTIDVAILVHEGRQYYVKDVQFRGVDSKLEARLRRKLPRGSWLFNSAVLEKFFKDNQSLLPPNASPEDDVELHRNPEDATVALVFDLRPCSGPRN